MSDICTRTLNLAVMCLEKTSYVVLKVEESTTILGFQQMLGIPWSVLEPVDSSNTVMDQITEYNKVHT